MFATVKELITHLAVPIPNEHTERLASKARELDSYVQTGTMIAADPRWPGVVFNTTCLIGPEGILYKYRKVNPWIPYEVHASPHDVDGYSDPLFPVADTGSAASLRPDSRQLTTIRPALRLPPPIYRLRKTRRASTTPSGVEVRTCATWAERARAECDRE